MTHQSNVSQYEIDNFAQHAADWWNPEGAFKTLHAINPIRLEFILQHCKLAEKTVLDVGCGGGILSESMARAGAKVTGLDLETSALAIARAHAHTHQLAVTYINSPVEDLISEPFDVITCMEMLEHVPHPEQIVHHCARLLKPGGHLFLSTINRTLPAYLTVILAAEYLLNLLPRQTHTFEKFIKPSELMTMIRAEKLQLTALRGIQYRPWAKPTLGNHPSTNYILVCTKLAS